MVKLKNLFSNIRKNAEVLLFVTILIFLNLFLLTKYSSHYSRLGIDPNYLDAITGYFGKYFYNFHLKPPGILLKDKVLSLIFPSHLIGKYNFLILSFLNTLGSYLFYKSTKIIFKSIWLSFFLGILFYVLSMIFIFWRFGLHYDHYNFFIHSYIIYSWTRLLFVGDEKLHPALSISLGVLFYSPAILFIPLTTILYFFKNRGQLKTLTLPLLVFLLIILKNYVAHGLLSPSSLSGSTRLTTAYYFHGGYKKLLSHVESGAYPSWWKKCFKLGHDLHHEFVGPLYGTCYFKTTKSKYDFNFLLENISPIEDTRVTEAIERDKTNLLKYPNLFSGPVPEFSSSFSVFYGKIASKVWKDLVIKVPKEAYSFIRHTFLHYTLKRGGNFFSGTSYEPQYMPLKFPFPYLLKKFFLFLHFISIFTPILFFIEVFKLFRKRQTIKQLRAPLLLISSYLSFFGILFLFSILVCCENDRMYASLTPYLIISSGITIGTIFKLSCSFIKSNFSRFV